MDVPLIGLLVSFTLVVFLSVLYRFEAERGIRFVAPLRARLDHVIIRLSRALATFGEHIGQDFLRQSAHYFFHTILVVVLHSLKQIESRVQVMIRSNRLLSRKARRERRERNKLDEIAEHKAAVALSPEEQREHKDRMLEGDSNTAPN